MDREAVVKSVRRPSHGRRTLVERRFLLGLPNGWNDDRDTETGSAAAAEDPETKRPVLRLASGGDRRITVWGEPFQTGDPSARHTVSFRCRGSGEWSAQAVTDGRRTLGAAKCDLGGGGWRTVTFGFMPDELAQAFAVKFTGTGELLLDDLRVGIGEAPPERAFACDCALSPAGGEIAGLTRIWFLGEETRVRWATEGAPAGAVLKLSFADMYGRKSPLRDIPLNGGGLEKGVFDVSSAVAGRTGQFRVTAEVFKGDEAVSAPDEFVFTRIARPVGWGRDMPDSPFGVHMEPRPGTIAAMKACGINWTRLHDAATRCTGWNWLEPEKGKWTFFDDSIARFRKGHIKIFAQLGTAPAWATHYGELGIKYFGYFKRYLRPVDMAAWTNYVATVAKRYRGTIDEYFIWNEPWGRPWKSADDLKFYDKSRTAQDFGAFQTATYRAVKAVDPGIKVSGFNTFNGGAAWTAGVAEGGGWDSCDIVDYHVYTQDLRARRDDKNCAMAAFRPLLGDHPHLDGRPVYMSEGQGTSSGSDYGGGRMSGLYERLVPWEPESAADIARCADATCRFTLSLLAAGDARVFLYTAHGYGGLVSPAPFAVLVGADGYPHPSLAAYAFFTHALEGRVFAGKGDFGAKGCVYEFRASGERRGTVRLYTDLDADEADQLAKSVPLRDLYGNPYSRDTWFKGSLLYATSWR